MLYFETYMYIKVHPHVAQQPKELKLKSIK